MTSKQRGPLERDTCRDLVVPALRTAGWAAEAITPEYALAQTMRTGPDGTVQALPGRRVDYVLEIAPGQPVAVVEAKRAYRSARDGLQQALDYAKKLEVPLAIATNGSEIIVHDRSAGTERKVDGFPTPVEAWDSYRTFMKLEGPEADLLLEPLSRRKVSTDGTIHEPRYYQALAISAVLRAIARGDQRILLLMATGTGKTFTAMQIVAKILGYQEKVRPEENYRVLYLADRDVLLTQPMRNDFGPAFGNERLQRVRLGADQSGELYFASYQALHQGAAGEELLEQFPRDFFDLVIVDECHRGSATANSRWRGTLDHFASAIHLGLTATPRDDTVHSYEYFGNPVYRYSLRDGIEDGYLAPYRIRRVILDADAEGWTPDPGQRDLYGREIPAGVYTTRDYERALSLLPRTKAMAHHLSGLLRQNPEHKAIVFCVSTQHADDVRSALVVENPDLVRADPEWVVRIVGVEEEKARLLEAFCDTESASPVVATTSRLLSTGVDVPDLRYVVIFRPVGSSIEFKQIVGRGTRLFPEGGKSAFEVVDYVGASQHFSDPDFDGTPPDITIETTDGSGDVVESISEPGSDSTGTGAPAPAPADPTLNEPEPEFRTEDPDDVDNPGGTREPRTTYVVVDGVVTVTSEAAMVIDRSTGEPRMVEVRTVVEGTMSGYGDAASLGTLWADESTRHEILESLAGRGIDLDGLRALADESGSDLFDVLLSMAFQTPVRTRAERARRARESHAEEIRAQSEAGRAVLVGLLQRYEEFGIDDISMRTVRLRPISNAGSITEIASAMGGPDALREAVRQVPDWLYGA